MTLRICTARIRTTAALLTGAGLLSAGLLSAGCGASPAEPVGPGPAVNVRAASLQEGFGTMDRLVEAARREGELNVIALPRDWVNYGRIIDTFSDKYGIEVRELEPGASSRRALDVAGRLRPDVFDLTLDVAVAEAGRFAPYRVRGWQDLTDDLKDPSGAWYAAYGGYMSIGYDPRAVPAPASFADLARPGYKVALDGDPLRAKAAFDGVMAASLRDGRARPERGVELFARLKRTGQLTEPAKANTVVTWDHLNAARAARDPGAWRVVVPRDAPLGAYHVQAISKDAPHPAAARLWQEFLFSDEGQNLLQEGYARPARAEAMRMRGTLDAEQAARLPRVPGPPVVLTIPQTDAARSYLKRVWGRSMR